MAPLLARLKEQARLVLAPDQPPRDVDLLCLRLDRFGPDLLGGLSPIYGGEEGFERWLALLWAAALQRFAERSEALRILDLRRLLQPDWLQRAKWVGYVCYVDRFSATLAGARERIDYLEELGVTYLHLMPLLRTRAGENDGGYAVADYRAVDPALGSAEDLEALAAALRERGISLCIDLVLNHVAREHAWARSARAGDPRYQGYFWLFADRALPDAYEQSLPEVFPDFAPGNFTWEQALRKWVWTTFNAYQWDLNWKNPQVFSELADVILAWANRGVEVFRLDAIAFIWKRLGTDCQNQPEVHALVQALRALVRIIAPAVAFKAEAIVGPRQLVGYLGLGQHSGKVSDMAYHNSLMVQIWSALASRDTRLMRRALSRLVAKPASATWCTYLRCHDDIGWAIDDDDAAGVGLAGPAQRAFCAEYYAGTFPGSHARGADFQANPKTGDRRTCGTAASLAGVELALEQQGRELLRLAGERLLCAHAVLMVFDGMPLIYMGDEIGLQNDYSFLDDPRRARDSRWIHRPAMDWQKADRRHQPGTVEHHLFSGLSELVRARWRCPQLHAACPLELLDADNPAVLAVRRCHPEGTLVALFNFSERPQRVLLPPGAAAYDRLTELAVPVADGLVELTPYGRLWLG